MGTPIGRDFSNPATTQPGIRVSLVISDGLRQRQVGVSGWAEKAGEPPAESAPLHLDPGDASLLYLLFLTSFAPGRCARRTRPVLPGRVKRIREIMSGV